MASETKKLINFLNGDPITNKEAIRLIKNYKDNGDWQAGKTKSVFFTKETLEHLLRYINDMQGSGGGKVGSGVRIYTGRYKNVDSYPPDKRNRRTLVFMPTYQQNGEGYHFDDISVEEVRKLKREIEDEDNDVFDISPYNHGELCPNNCSGTNIVEGLS